MTPIEQAKQRRKKVMQWQAPRSVVQIIRIILILLCATLVFTWGQWSDDDGESSRDNARAAQGSALV